MTHPLFGFIIGLLNAIVFGLIAWYINIPEGVLGNVVTICVITIFFVSIAVAVTSLQKMLKRSSSARG